MLSWLNGGGDNNDGDGGFKPSMMLTARPLSWLLLSPPSFLLNGASRASSSSSFLNSNKNLWRNLKPANCRIYFHVEERALRKESLKCSSRSSSVA